MGAEPTFGTAVENLLAYFLDKAALKLSKNAAAVRGTPRNATTK